MAGVNPFELLAWMQMRGRWLLLAVLAAGAIVFWPSGPPPRLPLTFRSESVMCLPSDWNGCDQVLLQHLLSSPEFLDRVSGASGLSPDEVRAGMGFQAEVTWDGRVRRIHFSAMGSSPQSSCRLAESLVGEQIRWLQEEMSRSYDEEMGRLEKQLAELEGRRKQAYMGLLKLSQARPRGDRRALQSSLDFWESELRRVELQLLEPTLVEPDELLGAAMQKLEQLKLVFVDKARPLQAQAQRVASLQRLADQRVQQRHQGMQRQLGRRRQRCMNEIQRLNQELRDLEQRRLDVTSELRRGLLEQEWKALDSLMVEVQFQLFRARRERHRARREGGFLILQSASAGMPVEMNPPRPPWGRTRTALLLAVMLGVISLHLWDQLRRHCSLERVIVEQLSLPLLGVIPRT